MKRLFFAIALPMLLLTSCGDDEPEQSEASVNFEVQLTNGEEKVSLYDTAHLQEEYDFYLSLFKLYVSNITFISADGGEVLVKDVVLLRPGTEDRNAFSARVPSDKYTELKLGFGLDPQQNNSDPADFENEHPLSSYQQMWWGMLKYRFATFEGKASSRVSGEDNILISYHPGTDPLYQTRGFNIALEETSSYNIKLSMDLNAIFGGPAGDIDLATEASSDSNPDDIHIAEKFIKNMAASAQVSVDSNP